MPSDPEMTERTLPPALAGLDRAELANAISQLPEAERVVASDRLEERVALGTIAKRRGLEPDDVANSYRRAVHQLHRQLGLAAEPPSPPTKIPATEMDGLYEAVKAKHGARDSDSVQRSQLTIAERYLANPSSLAKAFGRSVEKFSSYSNVDEPFHPHRRDPTREGHGKSVSVGGTADFAAKLIDQEQMDGDGLSLEYVDHEVWPARTTGGARFTDCRSARQAPRLDLLLADGEDRTPVVAEVKVRNDQHPFYALIQLLMLAAQVASVPQLERLMEWYSGCFGDDDDRIDLAILLADNPDKGEYRPRLFEITEELSGLLLDCDQVRQRIRRISCIDVRLDDNGLTAERRFCHER